MATKILAVDDEEDILLIIKTSLMAEGFNVVTATNGYDAIDMAKAEKPDLILLDMMMPGMDGYEVISELRSSDETLHIPIIMLTGVSDKSKIIDALNMGINYYITKPFDYNDLVAKVRMAMKEAKCDDTGGCC